MFDIQYSIPYSIPYSIKCSQPLVNVLLIITKHHRNCHRNDYNGIYDDMITIQVVDSIPFNHIILLEEPNIIIGQSTETVHSSLPIGMVLKSHTK